MVCYKELLIIMNQIRALWALLVVTLGGMGAWVWRTHEDLTSTQTSLYRAEASKKAALEQKDAEHQDAVAALNAQHDKDVQKLSADFEKELDGLRKDERSRLAQAYEQFSHILDGDKKTVDYINLIEQKVKSGEKVSKEEAEKLAVIATGLTYLQKQYRKPFEDFGELETYLSKRATTPIETPNMRNAFWKRMFSREFREKEREFYRTEGERRGFQEASDKFKDAYASAQKKMAAVNIDMEKTIGKLNDVIQEKQANTQDFGDFFNQARKALSTHQKLLEFEPDATKPVIEGTKP